MTVNSDRYVATCFRIFYFSLEENEWDKQYVWFLQDGATVHTVKVSMNVILEIFAGRLIFRNGNISWPPRSPDLSPSDFFLWGYLKCIVYEDKPSTIPEFIFLQFPETEIAAIPVTMLTNVKRNFDDRLQEYINIEGRLLPGIIFRS